MQILPRLHHYPPALKGNSVNKSASIAATVTFTVITYGLKNETDLTFLPKTLVKTADEAIRLKEKTSAKIIINPSFFQYTSSFITDARLLPGL